MTTEQMMCRVCENAMAKSHIRSHADMARRLGCGRDAIKKMLEGTPVTLRAETFILLFQLGGTISPD